MAKFAQIEVSRKSAGAFAWGPKLVQGKPDLFPKTTKGAPIQDALQKTGADLLISWSAEEFLVTKAHVFCPFHSR